jgi:hypothetical protein
MTDTLPVASASVKRPCYGITSGQATGETNPNEERFDDDEFEDEDYDIEEELAKIADEYRTSPMVYPGISVVEITSAPPITAGLGVLCV